MTVHPLLEKAAQHTAQARAINDEFQGKSMPAEAARQMEQHLKMASEYRARVNREAQLTDVEQWIAEPQYKHDMGGGEQIAEAFGHGALMEKEMADLRTKAFFDYCRKGMNALSPEAKAALVEDSTGQNLVPSDFAGTILKELPREATIRNLAFVRPTSKNLVDVGNVVINTAGWGKLETGATATDGLPATPAAKQTIKVHDLNALVKLGRDELEDSDENLAEIIRGALSLKFAELEDDAFAAGLGDASNQPWAITHNVNQKITAAAGETVTADDLKKLTFKVPAQFRKKSRAVFLGHTDVEQAVALLKDTTGNYLLQPSVREGEPSTLFGYRWYTVDGLAAPGATVGATDKSCVFGDVYAGYMVADRRQLTVVRLEELYAAEGKIGLLFTHRVGGDVIREKALAYYEV